MNKMNKTEILRKIEELTLIMDNSIKVAKDSSYMYSKEESCKLSFEVGYLCGTIKSIISELRKIK